LKVAGDETGKQHEAQFSSGRLDYWSIEVLDKSRNNDARSGDA